MPYIIRPRQVVRSIAGAFASGLLVVAAPAVASAACPASLTSRAFSAYGDVASYELVQDGTFQSGASGWSLNNAEVIAEGRGEGHDASGEGGEGLRALKIRSHGSAVSPGFCVNSQYPTFRFLLRQLWGGGRLNVSLRWGDRSGSHEAPVASLQSGSAWSLSPVLQLASNLPLAGSEGTLNPVQLVFASAESRSVWAITHVYIDPYSR